MGILNKEYLGIFPSSLLFLFLLIHQENLFLKESSPPSNLFRIEEAKSENLTPPLQLSQEFQESRPDPLTKMYRVDFVQKFVDKY